jgi:hypothetical protein
MDNLFHALFHAIPTLELYQMAKQIEEKSLFTLLPRYVVRLVRGSSRCSK